MQQLINNMQKKKKNEFEEEKVDEIQFLKKTNSS